MFSGDIQGVGPRYCPSIEDKVKRFPDRGRHQIFLEPEGLNTESIYPNGMSTSLPEESQLEFLRSIEGLEKVEILKPGYAVEYDSLDPTELNPNLMSSHVEGLFFAGQVNRSSGYEEAAAQGLWAGINAGRYLNGDLKGLRPDRSRSYMETLVEDLVFKGTKEPYRLFTSRSEYRLHLREDNAHDRMIDLGLSEGLLSPEYLEKKTQLDGKVKEIENTLKTKRKRVSKDRMISLFELLKRPEENWEKISMEEGLNFENALAVEKVEIQSKYSGYLGRIESEIKSLKKAKELSIDYDRWNDCKLAGVSAEVREKVLAERPENIYELSRMSGVSSVDLLTISKSLGVKRERVSHETM